jgi:hypothetical protein
MKKFVLVVFIFAGLLVPIRAEAAPSCINLSSPAIASDGLTVNISSMKLTDKPGSTQLGITYKLQNLTNDKKIDEGTFTLFFKDGSSLPQYGFFGTLFPADSKDRNYQWEFLKNQEPVAVQYDSFSGSGRLDIAKIFWGIPGSSCPNVTYDSGAAVRDLQVPTLGGTCLDIGKKVTTSQGELTCSTNESDLSLSLASSSCKITAAGDLAKEQSCLANSYKGKVIWTLGKNSPASSNPNKVTDAASAIVDAANESKDAANAATDAALAAADAADAATAAAQDAADAATSVGADLINISTQIKKLTVALENATTSLASVTTAFENARAQVTKSQASMNASNNASQKLALSSALSKLANAVLILSSSKSKLSAQVNVLDARKSSLLNAEKQLLGKSDNGKTSNPSLAKPVVKEKVIVCLKGKSSLKVIGKNPKCPAGYTVKK